MKHLFKRTLIIVAILSALLTVPESVLAKSHSKKSGQESRSKSGSKSGSKSKRKKKGKKPKPAQTSEVMCSIAQPVLWPPNKDFVDVGLDIFVSGFEEEGTVVGVFVFSDEPNSGRGYGNHSPDVGEINLEGTLELRAERSGRGNGRVYLVLVVVEDSAGNLEYCCNSVVVPKSKSRRNLFRVYREALKAEEFCRNNESSPDGYYLIGEETFQSDPPTDDGPPEPTPEPTPEPQPEPQPEPTPEPTPEPQPEPQPEPTPLPSPEEPPTDDSPPDEPPTGDDGPPEL